MENRQSKLIACEHTSIFRGHVPMEVGAEFQMTIQRVHWLALWAYALDPNAVYDGMMDLRWGHRKVKARVISLMSDCLVGLKVLEVSQ